MPRKPKAKAPLDWSRFKIERRNTDALLPYARNPRQHSPAQLEKIAASMREFGWTMPVLIDEDDQIIAGHGRVQAAGILKLAEIPVIVARGWSDDQKRAYLIADNRLTELGTWDQELLKFQLTELAKSEFDLQLTGFDSIESVNFLSGLEVPSSAPEAADTEADERPDDRELKPSEMKLYREAWRRVMSDWDDLTKAWEERRYFSANFTKGSLAVYFVRSLFFGDNIPRGATTPYTGHRFFVAGEKYAIAAAFKLAIRDNSVLDSMIWQCGGRPAFDKMFGSLAIHGHRAPADFPAILARSLIEEFTKSGAHILDPCHGWGGRMLGFLLSKTAAHYHGFEVDPKTRDGVQEIFNDLKSLAPRAKSCNLVLRPFEESKLKPSSYDFALTSPPYFDVEKYNGDKSSWRRYPKFDAWVDGFYRPLIEKTAAALKTRAIFALQVGNQSYPLEDKAKEIAGTCGLRFVEKRSTNMRNNYTETAAEEGEIVLIFEKASASSSPRKDKKDAAEKYGSIL